MLHKCVKCQTRRTPINHPLQAKTEAETDAKSDRKGDREMERGGGEGGEGGGAERSIDLAKRQNQKPLTDSCAKQSAHSRCQLEVVKQVNAL